MGRKFFVFVMGLLMSVQLFAVDLNMASIEELSALKGIGASTAKKIIEHRASQKFTSVEELMQIKGIGQKKFDAIKEELTI